MASDKRLRKEAMCSLKKAMDGALRAMLDAIEPKGAFFSGKDNAEKADTRSIKEFVGALNDMEKLVRVVYGEDVMGSGAHGSNDSCGVVMLPIERLLGGDE